MKSNRSRHAGWILLAPGLALLACAVNPATGRRQLMLVSEDQEIAMGQESDPQIVATYGVYDDAKLAAYVDAVGQKMARLSDRPNLKFTFRVLDSPVVNAFALPGGYVYITRGILAHINNEAELAVIMGHEIGHVTARHGAHQQSRATLAGLGLGIGSLLSPQVARLGQVAQQALGLLFLKYSREDETQADQLGVKYSTAAGYDPEAGVQFFHVLDRMSKESGQSLPTWLATHPAPADRIAHTAQLSAEAKRTHPGPYRIAESEHKAHLEGVIFGANPRQGFVEGSTFKHPDLKFQVEFPNGWQVQNEPSAVVALEPGKHAMLQMTLEKTQGLGLREYAARLAETVHATLAQEAIPVSRGTPYHVVLEVPDQAGGATPVQLALVPRDAASVYQFVGQTEAGAFGLYQPYFLGAAASLHELTDPKALVMEPNRVHVQSVRGATTFAQAFGQAASPVPIAAVALINDLQIESNLTPGFELKLVRGSYKPANPAP
jgi:predicted Zn-dependent protease